MVIMVIAQLLLSALSLLVMIKLKKRTLRWGLSLFLNMGLTLILCIISGAEVYIYGVNTIQTPFFIFGGIIIAIVAIIGISGLVVGNFFKKNVSRRTRRRRI